MSRRLKGCVKYIPGIYQWDRREAVAKRNLETRKDVVSYGKQETWGPVVQRRMRGIVGGRRFVGEGEMYYKRYVHRVKGIWKSPYAQFIEDWVRNKLWREIYIKISGGDFSKEEIQWEDTRKLIYDTYHKLDELQGGCE